MARGKVAAMARELPTKNKVQLLNMNFGFLGIQFGWTLQMANMSAIYEHLKASPSQIPSLWLAAPLTGLIVQPIIGYLSDRTWGPLGRRRPYFLFGAILSTLALIAMPNATTLAGAAALLWVLDACINISMEPFRAFVADILPPAQRPQGFATQSLLIGLGSIVAALLPKFLSDSNLPPSLSGLPGNVTWAFYAGAIAFISAVLWTVFTTSEYPPEAEAPVVEAERPRSPFPKVLLALAPIQFLTWLGLFCMWQFLPIAVAHHVFGATDENSALYREGLDWGGVCIAGYSAVTFLFSFALPRIAARLGSGITHGLCLLAGGAGLLSCYFIHSQYEMLGPMIALGIAWASILSLPYALLSRELDSNNTGLWMGIFNGCIVLPEIFQALTFGWFMENVLHNDRMTAVCVGGGCLSLAALLCFFLLSNRAEQERSS